MFMLLTSSFLLRQGRSTELSKGQPCLSFGSVSLYSLLFMSATDEELDYVHDNGMDHVTYVLGGFR